MNHNKPLKIFAFVAFVALMLVSCWATVESLHLLLPSWPVPAFWVVTVIVFVFAALGTKLIVDSFNQRIRVDNRGWKLIGGIILLIFCWIAFGLPTNTHTFFYRSVIKDVLVKDLTETKGKLQNLANEGEAGKIIAQEKADFKNKIDATFAKFAAEINNPGNPGWSNRAESIIIELEGELGKIQRLQLRSNNFQDRQVLIQAMREQIDKLLASRLTIYDQRLANINHELDKPDLQNLIAEIQGVQNKMQAMPTNNNEPTEKTSMVLSQAYKIIDNYSDVLKNEFEKSYPDKIKMVIEDKKAYSGVSKTERMRSVIEVWKDFFDKKFAGRGFIFWVIIAAIVDVLGFIAFDLAFKIND
jgi:hypothetical protein